MAAGETQESKKEPGEKEVGEPSTRSLGALAFGFVGVLAVIGLLFFAQRERRLVELEDQYARVAAHLAKEVELKLSNYRSMVDNATRITTGEATRAEVAVSKANAARTRLTATRIAAEESERRRKEALERESAARAFVTRAAQSPAELQPAAEKVKTALLAAETANAAAKQTMDDAKVAAERASKAAEPAPGSTPPAEPAGDADARAIELAARAEKAQVTADRAGRQLSTALAEAETGPVQAVAPNPAAGKGVEASKDRSASKVALELAQAESAERDKLLRDALQLAQQEDREIADVIAGFKIRVLPSYVERIVRNCLLPLEQGKVALCAAREIAEVVGTRQQGLEIGPCPESVKRGEQTVVLSGDGTALVIPPRHGTEAPAACGKLPVARLMSQAPRASGNAAAAPADGFERVFLLDAAGEALFPTREVSASSVENESALRLLAFPDFDPKQARASLMRSQVPIGPQKYRAFIQPVGTSYRKDVEGSATLRGFFVAGVVPEKTLFYDSIKVSPIASLLAALLVAFGVLSLPLAKLWFLSPKARFGRLHVGILITSALLTALLATVLVLAAVAHNRLATRLDRQLDSVGREFAERLANRVKNTTAALDTFTKAESVSKMATVIASPEADLEASCSAGGGRLGFAPFEGEPKLVPVCERPRFAFGVERGDWNSAFLTDRRGMQRAKFVPGPHSTLPVSLADRRYFQRAREAGLRCKESKEPCGPPAAREVVRSVTTGNLVLVVARAVVPGATKATTAESGVAIGVVESKLDEFSRTVLPLGFRALVVDSAGRIMVDSSNAAEPGQTLLDDVDRPGTFTAMLNARVADTTDVRYLGIPSRARILPVAGTDWMVLSVAPRALVDLPVTNVVLVTLFGVGTALAALLLLLAATVPLGRVVGLVRTGRLESEHPPTLRPHTDESVAYAEAGIWMIGASIVLCVIALLDFETIPLVLMLFFVLLAGVYGLWSVPGIGKYGPWGEPMTRGWKMWLQKRLSRAPVRQHGDWREYLPFSYALCFFGLASALVVTPAVVVFVSAYDTVSEHLVRSEQDHYVRELGGRNQCLPGFKDEPCPEVYGSGEESVAEVSSERLLASCWFRPTQCFLDLLPLLDVTTDRRDALLFRVDRATALAGAAPVRGWTRSPDTVELHLPETKNKYLQTKIPRLLSTEYGSLAFIIIVLTTMAAVSAAHVVSFQTLRRLFFLETLSEQRATSMCSPEALLNWRPKAPERADKPGRLCLLSPPEELEAILDADSRFIDVLSEPSVEPASNPTWFLRDTRGTALKDGVPPRLWAAIRSSRPIVFLSAIDPRDSTPPRTSPELLKEWGEALENFEFVRIGPRVFTDANREAMREAWLALSEDAKRMLAQVAHDDYATPHPANAEAMKELADRGLIDPGTFRMMSEPLRNFVVDATTSKQLKEWSDADKNSVWGAIRVPLSTGVAAFVALLTVSKPELAAAGAVMPTLAAGVPALLKILSSAIQK